MNIGVDIDGVTANLMQPTLKLAKNVFGVEILMEELVTYGSIPVLSEGKISRSMMYHLFDMAWADYHSMPLMEPDIPRILRELRKAGHQITIISHRSPRSQVNCLLWMGKIPIDYDCVIFPDHNISKLLYPWDILIDDHPKIPEQARDFPERKVLFRTQPWNRSVNSLPGNVVRIESFGEILDHVA